MEENLKLQASSPHSLARTGSLVGFQELEVLDVSPEEVPHLLDYWHLVLKRRWTVLACALIVFSTVAIGTLKKRPIYEGTVTIEINPDLPQVFNFKEVGQIEPSVDVDAYRGTQFSILKSRSLAETVVKDLQLYRVPEFYGRRSLFGLFEGNPAKIPSPSEHMPDTSSEAFRNSVAHLQSSLDVSPERRSNLVDVSFDSESKELAQQVANQIATDYIKGNLQAKWDEAASASQWLETRLVDLQVQLEKDETALQAYAQANSIIQINEKETMSTSRLEELMQAYTKAQAERYQRQSLYSVVEKGKVQDLPEVLQNRLIQDLEERLVDLRKDYALETAYVKPNFPKAAQIKKQMDALEAQINEKKLAVTKNIEDDYRAALAQEEYLRKAVEDQKQVANDIAARSVQYNILKRKAESTRQLYEGLLERMKQARVSNGLSASNIRVVDPAELPQGAVKPRVLLNLAVGLILGLGLGVALAFFQEYLDNTLKSPDEVEKLLRLPSLGVLPSFTVSDNGRLEDGAAADSLARTEEMATAPAIQTDPLVVEAFRSLRTSILLSASPVPKVILITSALPGEGKTTATMNLGATLASLGSKVVIVDCDMRRPACHFSAGVKNSPGFVQCLTGRVDLADAILPVPGVKNLSVIPCGPIPPNPAEVLSSPLTGELLRKLRSEFEYVLVDSPPLLSVADSRILATLTDAAVLVTRAFETPYDLVRRARSLLYSAGVRILGVALNDVDLRGEGYAGHLSYRYGYGYKVQPADEPGLHKSA
jgi:polysaccharide biosynthesis transport protein